jgi:hypothetical protein
MGEITKEFKDRIVARAVDQHYLEIVKSLDMEALARLITLEVARQVAGRVGGKEK